MPIRIAPLQFAYATCGKFFAAMLGTAAVADGVVSEATNIPLGLVFALIGSILGGCVVVIGAAYHIGKTNQQIQDRINEIKTHGCNQLTRHEEVVRRLGK